MSSASFPKHLGLLRISKCTGEVISFIAVKLSTDLPGLLLPFVMYFSGVFYRTSSHNPWSLLLDGYWCVSCLSPLGNSLRNSDRCVAFSVLKRLLFLFICSHLSRVHKLPLLIQVDIQVFMSTTFITPVTLLKVWFTLILKFELCLKYQLIS